LIPETSAIFVTSPAVPVAPKARAAFTIFSAWDLVRSGVATVMVEAFGWMGRTKASPAARAGADAVIESVVMLKG